jgi:hypothetical protein
MREPSFDVVVAQDVCGIQMAEVLIWCPALRVHEDLGLAMERRPLNLVLSRQLIVGRVTNLVENAISKTKFIGVAVCALAINHRVTFAGFCIDGPLAENQVWDKPAMAPWAGGLLLDLVNVTD